MPFEMSYFVARLQSRVSSQPEQVDIAIIGGGPVGLFAAYYAGLRNLHTCLIDSLDVLGGQLVVLYPEKYVYDVAGFPKILAKDLAHQLIQQAMQYHPSVRLGQRALELGSDETARTFTLTTDGEPLRARAIVISAGIGSFSPKVLALPEAGAFLNHGLYYSVKEPESFRHKKVLIVGGGDSAVDWANALASVAGQVTLIHRRDEFRAHEDSITKMWSSGTRILVFRELRQLRGDGSVRQAVVFDNRTQGEQTLDVDAVLVNIGFDSSLGPILQWGLKLEKRKIVVDACMRTSRPGVFAAGDIVTHPGKLNLIATGFGEAATAVNFAKVWIDPAAHAFPGHSSEIVKK
jgi:thioredoxin reductase (NADPH)